MQELEYIMQIMRLFYCALSYIFRFRRHLIESWFPPLNFLWLQVIWGKGMCGCAWTGDAAIIHACFMLYVISWTVLNLCLVFFVTKENAIEIITAL